jgi:2-oxoglutarate ferredoxin oxidoreductase subunit beta
MGADSTFIARSMDRDPKHLQEVLKRGYYHKGTSLIEIYQNCNVFNDGAFEIFTDKGTKKEETLFLEHGKPLIFGENSDKGIKLDGFHPQVVDLKNVSPDELWIHDETDRVKAGILVRFFDNPTKEGHLPRPFGVFYTEDRPRYEEAMAEQLAFAKENYGDGNLDKLIAGRETWVIN